MKINSATRTCLLTAVSKVTGQYKRETNSNVFEVSIIDDGKQEIHVAAEFINEVLY